MSRDRTGDPLSCPACGAANIEREPDITPPPAQSHVTLRCVKCGRVARYIAGAA